MHERSFVGILFPAVLCNVPDAIWHLIAVTLLSGRASRTPSGIHDVEEYFLVPLDFRVRPSTGEELNNTNHQYFPVDAYECTGLDANTAVGVHVRRQSALEVPLST
jgi:hypothetical protein